MTIEGPKDVTMSVRFQPCAYALAYLIDKIEGEIYKDNAAINMLYSLETRGHVWEFDFVKYYKNPPTMHDFVSSLQHDMQHFQSAIVTEDELTAEVNIVISDDTTVQRFIVVFNKY